jgi:hypothetical protein
MFVSGVMTASGLSRCGQILTSVQVPDPKILDPKILDPKILDPTILELRTNSRAGINGPRPVFEIL